MVSGEILRFLKEEAPLLINKKYSLTKYKKL